VKKGEEWRAHEITQINLPKFKGKRLDSFDLDTLLNLQKAWVVGHADTIAKNPAKKLDADMINMAVKGLQKTK
jgi:hypothetical protein